MNNYIKDRLKKLRTSMQRKNYNAFFIYNRANTIYFTGFRGSSSFALITEDKNYFITDFRYIEYAINNITGFKIIRQSNDVFEDLKKIVEKGKLKIIAIESDLPLNIFEKLKKILSKTKLISDGNLIESLRIIKDDDEIKDED